MPDVTVSSASDGLAQGWDLDEFWVAESRGRIVGYVRFVLPDGRRVGWLDDLYVRPEHAGRGVGTALLDVVKAALPGGFGLWTYASNRPAGAFYAAHGLREVSRTPPERALPGEAEVEWEWASECSTHSSPVGHGPAG